MHRITTLISGLLLAGAALAAEGPGTPQAAFDVDLRPGEDPALHGEMTLELPGSGPLGMTLGPGFTLTSVEMPDGEIDRQGERGVILHPDGATRAHLAWRGTPPAGSRAATIDAAEVWLPAAAGWYPRPAERYLGYELSLTLPRQLQAVADGSRVADETTGERRRVAFRHHPPATGINLFAGEWEQRSRAAEHGTVYTFFPEHLADYHDLYLERTAAYLDEYSEWIGPPAHETFSVAAPSRPVGLAFAGLTLIGERVVPLPFIPETSLPHEVVHNWWGRGVYTDREHGNWSEALTHYMGDYHQAAARDPERAGRMRSDWLHAQAALPEADDYPLRAFQQNRGTIDEIVGYQRGAFLFHTLRRKLGDEGFDTAVRRFYQEHRHTSASWPDLRSTFERAAASVDRSPERVAAIFEAFLERTGTPELRMDERTLEVTPEEDSYRVSVEVAWDEDAGYRAAVPMVLTGEGGSEARRTVSLAPGERRRVELTVDTPPEYLQADPGHHVYRDLARGERVPVLRGTLLAEEVRLSTPWDGLLQTARHTLEGSVAQGEPDADKPLLIIDEPDAIREALEAINACFMRRSPPTDKRPAAWASTTGGGQPLIAIAAGSGAEAERALQRLGRYGRHSYVGLGDGHEAEEGLYRPADRHGLRLPLAEHVERSGEPSD